MTDWIICQGAQRDVDAGEVKCPLRTRPTALGTCLQCRHLQWWAEERASGPSCAVDEELGPSARPDHPAASGAVEGVTTPTGPPSSRLNR